MTRPEAAVALFKQGFSCSQAILATFSEELGLDRATALRVASGFGGGMGRMGETCGAVTGAIMVLGLKHGSAAADDRQAKEVTYAKVQEFVHQFTARHQTARCKELLGLDISMADGLSAAKEKNLFATLCPGYVKDAAEILERLLDPS